MPKLFRVTIDVDGIPRRVIAIREQGNKDLILSFPASLVHRDAGRSIQVAGSRNHNRLLKQQRFTIHNSRKSKFEINEIVSHQVFRNGISPTSNRKTSAIKQGNRFDFVMGRQFPDLRNPKYLVDDRRGTLFSLGSYDPLRFSFYLAVFVGPPDRAFANSGDAANFNVEQQKFDNFSIVLLWSFLRLPSDDDGGINYLVYLDANGQTSISPGYDENEVVTTFNKVRDASRVERFGMIVQNSRRYLDLVLPVRPEGVPHLRAPTLLMT